VEGKAKEKPIMDGKLRKILTECIREIESGDSSMEDCLQRYPDRAAELRPHLELWGSLNAAAKAQPNFGSQQRGQQQLLGALADMERRGDERRMIPAFAKAAVVVAAAVLLIGGAAGASAALGGPDVAGEVLSGIGISNASQTGRDHANPNALDGANNAGQGINNASETGRERANENALDGPEKAGQGINNASETGREHANENALDGPDNADDPDGNADGAADDVPDGGDVPGDVPPEDVPPEDVPPEDVPPDDVPPEVTPVPDSVPAEPQP
jgi:hypothetical protein